MANSLRRGRKLCTACEVSHAISSFRLVKSNGYSWYSSVCKKIESKRGQEWSKSNITKSRKTKKQSSIKRRNRNHEFIAQYLIDHPCVDCGEDDLLVLDFDHVYGKKKAGISNLIAHGVPIHKLETEIAKCAVRCANCHRRRTAQAGYITKLRAIEKVLSCRG